jgi:hypothetical protein
LRGGCGTDALGLPFHPLFKSRLVDEVEKAGRLPAIGDEERSKVCH